MFTPDQKVKTKKDNQFLSAGTVVTIAKDMETKEVITGKTGMILCNVPGGGALSFREDELEAINGAN